MLRFTSVTLSLGLLLSACQEPDPVDCTTEAIASVNVTVRDGTGERTNAATVRASIDGAEAFDCDFMGDGLFACGWDERGTFTVTATLDGDEVTATATVDGDECHVFGEHLSLEFPFDLLPAAEVWVLDDGTPLECPNVWACKQMLTFCSDGTAEYSELDMDFRGTYRLVGDTIIVSVDQQGDLTLTLVEEGVRSDGGSATWLFDPVRTAQAYCPDTE